MLEPSNTDQEMVTILFKNIAPIEPTYGTTSANNYEFGHQQSNIAMILSVLGGSIGMMAAIVVTMVAMIETTLTLTLVTFALIVLGHIVAVTVGAQTGNFIGEIIHSFAVTKNVRKTRPQPNDKAC